MNDRKFRVRYFENGKSTKRWRKMRWRGEEGDEERIEMCSTHIPTPHTDCNHFTLQICADKFFLNLLYLLMLTVIDFS